VAEVPAEVRPAPPAEVAHAALRGVVGAMAMTGMRRLMIQAGVMEEEPPRALVRQRLRGLLRTAPVHRRRIPIELFHWGVGAAGGIGFALLPEALRRRAWAGPAWGLAIWISFDAGLAPLLDVEHAEKRPVGQRAALIADHLLYGFVLSELRPRPAERG
jgi:hypothetical protein